MTRNKAYKNMRVLLRPSDMRRLSELRDALQRMEELGAPLVNDSEAVRRAIGLAHGLVMAKGMSQGLGKDSSAP